MLFELESFKVQEGFKRLANARLVEMVASGARFDTDEGPALITCYAPGIFRLHFEKGVAPDYGLLAAASPGVAEVRVQTTVGTDTFRLQTSTPGLGELNTIALELQTAPLRISFYAGKRLLVESVTDRAIQGDLRFSPFACKDDKPSSAQWLVSLALRSGEEIYGLGEKFGALNRRGQLVTNWNRDATGVNAEISYKNLPFAWSTEGWALFVNTPGRVTHAVGYSPWSHRTYVLKVEDFDLDLFLITGETPAELLERFTWLTGRTTLPPRWSYGVWMSRAFYKTADELLDVAHTLRQKRIPCDVITLDGRAWHKPETRFDFSWDPDRYPDPAGFIRALRELNLRLCLWEYPYLSTRNPLFDELDAKGFFLKQPDGQTYIHRWFPPPMDTMIPHLQPSGIVDFTNPQAYAWFRDAHKPLFELGVAVMKSDYGEAVPEDVVAYNGDSGQRLHNVYALLYNRCVFEATQMYGQGRPIVWGRAGWTGSQRYPVQWGGDPQGDWEGLAASIRGGLSWGMSGAPFYTHDIGGLYGHQTSDGFLGGGMSDPELFVRWTQAAVMASHTRFHGTSPREPWVFGERVENIVRQWLEWRYRLIPYLEACALEASQNGMPVLRAMPLAFPEERAAWSFDSQYMFGPALLVSPVLQAGGLARTYLPTGGWYDLWSGERLQGPRLVESVMPLERIPIYGREGQELRLGPVVQHTAELGDNPPVQVVYFRGQQMEDRIFM